MRALGVRELQRELKLDPTTKAKECGNMSKATGMGTDKGHENGSKGMGGWNVGTWWRLHECGNIAKAMRSHHMGVEELKPRLHIQEPCSRLPPRPSIENFKSSWEKLLNRQMSMENRFRKLIRFKCSNNRYIGTRKKDDYICMHVCRNMSINEPITSFLDFT